MFIRVNLTFLPGEGNDGNLPARHGIDRRILCTKNPHGDEHLSCLGRTGFAALLEGNINPHSLIEATMSCKMYIMRFGVYQDIRTELH